MKRNKSRQERESFLSAEASDTVPLDQRRCTERRGTNDPRGSDFRCRYFSFLTVMMMVMVLLIQSHVEYMQQWENDTRCSTYIKYEIKLQFPCTCKLYHFSRKMHIFRKIAGELFLLHQKPGEYLSPVWRQGLILHQESIKT